MQSKYLSQTKLQALSPLETVVSVDNRTLLIQTMAARPFLITSPTPSSGSRGHRGPSPLPLLKLVKKDGCHVTLQVSESSEPPWTNFWIRYLHHTIDLTPQQVMTNTLIQIGIISITHITIDRIISWRHLCNLFCEKLDKIFTKTLRFKPRPFSDYQRTPSKQDPILSSPPTTQRKPWTRF